MNRFKMNVVNCAMLGAFVCAMPKQPGGGYRRPIYPWGQIVGSVRHPAAERQVPTGHLHWMGSIPFLFSQNKTASRWDAVLFWSRVRESMADLPLGANRKERSASSCRTASAHRALALDGFDSLPFFQNKTASRWDAVLFWSRVRESNPPLWLGKRPFYR